MSHFTVMVIGENPEQQLAPFNENLEVPRFLEATKEQLIAQGRKEIEDYKIRFYDEFLRDPIAYKKGCSEGHINYIESEFPKKLLWTGEEIYQDQIKWKEAEDIGADGAVYSTTNPQGNWDWYLLGGRWSGMIKLKAGAVGVVGKGSMVCKNEVGIDQARKGDIENFNELTTYAVIKDGKWYERGKMGWWGIAQNEKDEDEWNSQLKELVKSLPDETLISIYDCHI